jgi:hypothetical protein
MANRSYIYGLKDGKYFSIGEMPNEIPYAYQVLAAYDNKVVDSNLFDKIVGIEADFNKGRAALYWLLDYLVAGKSMSDHGEFEEQVASTKQFLDAIPADTTSLENGEIYALYVTKEGKYLDGPGLEKANESTREDAQWVGEDIDHLKIIGIEPKDLFTNADAQKYFKWIVDLKDNWKELLGLDSWRSILYYQFKNAD